MRPVLTAAFCLLLLLPRAITAMEPTAPHHEIALTFHPASGGLSVTDSLDVSGRASLAFRLAPWMILRSASLDGRAVRPAREGSAYALALPEGAERLTLTLEGQVPSLPAEGWSGGAVWSPQGSFLPPGGGWHAETGERFGTFDLTVRLPEGQQAAATGDLVSEEQDASGLRLRFETLAPADSPGLFIGPYRVAERQAGPVRLRTYFLSGQTGLAPDYLEAAAGYLARYAEAIGPYPYRDFAIVAAPLPVGYGFRNLTYISSRILHLPYMRARSLAHEVLHAWWGNGIAVDYAQGNWAEGLTSYMADHDLAGSEAAGNSAGSEAAGNSAGSEAAQAELRLGWLRDYAALPASRDAPVRLFQGRTHDASQVVGYGKTAFLFHMLKREVGAAAFRTALRAFWSAHRGGVASWSELQTAFEQAASRDLGWFFAQWLDRKGAPEISIAAAGRDAADPHRVTLTLAQDEAQGDGPYRLRLPLRLETAEGTLWRELEMAQARQEFLIESGAPILGLALDPEQEVFRRLLPGEAPPILRDVTLAGDSLTLVAGESPDLRAAAAELAQAILDRPPQFVPAEQAAGNPAPLLLIGLTGQLESLLKQLGLPETPPELAGRGEARVWTARREGASPLLVVAADSSEALAGLQRSLPHYGGKSFLLYEGGQAVESGLWPSGAGPLVRRFDG